MAQINLDLDDRSLHDLNRYSARRRTPVSGLLQDYIAYLLAGGRPVRGELDIPAAEQLAEIAQRGGSFDWLAEEPDIYGPDDGEPL